MIRVNSSLGSVNRQQSINRSQNFKATAVKSHSQPLSDTVSFGNNEWEMQEARRLANKTKAAAEEKAKAVAERVRRVVDDCDSDFDEYDAPMDLTYG